MSDERAACTAVVVDADPAARGSIVKILREAGYRVSSLGSFQEAKPFLATTQPDLLIADIRLDHFNGLQLVIERRDDHPERASIVTNAYADQVLERDARRVGAPYLVKPVSPVELLRVAAGLLEPGQSSSTEKPRWPHTSLTGRLEAVN